MPTELTMLAWTVVLAVVQLVIPVLFFVAANGLSYAMGPRDAPAKPPGTLAGRAERAFRNLMETLPLAAAAILISAAANRHNGLTVLGSQLYFWGRLVYLPVYLAGIPAARTLVWAVSVVGIVLVLVGLLPG